MTETTRGTPPGVPANMITPTGNVPAIGVPNTQDYARLIFSAPYFETIAIAEIIQPSVTEAVENALPSLIPPYVDNAVLAGIQQYAVLLTGSTMSGPLFLNPLMPTADAQAATKAYVDAMLATAGIPEVPPVPVGQVWARETGAWVPISQSEGTFLPLTGGSMQGNINMSGNTLTNMAAVPAMPNGAAPAQWVLNQIASVSLYQGTWNADTNTPDLTQLSTHVNAYTWIAITTSPSGVVIGAAIPGLQGQTVFNGDTIIYSTVAGAFSSIHSGGITLPEADGRYVQLAGSQMSGALLLNSDATQNMQAVTFQQLEASVANTVTPDAPADGQAYARVGVGTNRWVPAMPLAGGIFTGAVTLAGPGAAGNNPVTVTQLNSAISAAQAGFLPIAGGTMTGPLVLNGNATANLNAVPLQQLNATLGTYAPIQNPAFSGVPTAPTATPATANTQQLANTAFVQSALAGFLPLAGGTMTGAINSTASGNFGPSTIGQVVLSGNQVTAQNLIANGYVFVGGSGGPYWENNGGWMYSPQGVQSGGMIIANGSRIISQGPGSQPTVAVYDTSGGFVWAIGAQLGNLLGFCTANAAGAPITFVGHIDGGGNMQINGTLSQGSDASLKDDIAEYAPGVSIAAQLLPKTFIYKTDPAKKQRLGFIAQDIEPLLPQAVEIMDLGESPSLGLDETAVIAVLANATKQLVSRVVALEAAAGITPAPEYLA